MRLSIPLRTRFAELAQQLFSREQQIGGAWRFSKDRDREMVAGHQSSGHYSELVQRSLRASFSLTGRSLLGGDVGPMSGLPPESGRVANIDGCLKC